MAAVKVTITGVLIDLYGRTISGPLKMVGELVRSDVGVGGGPILPEPPPEGGTEPPGIWPGPGDPDYPIEVPPSIWPDPPEGTAPLPEHPIVLPKPPGIQGPDLQVKVVWTPANGWQVVLVPAGPHPSPSSRRTG